MTGSASHEISKILSFHNGTGGLDSLGADFTIYRYSQGFLEQPRGASWSLVNSAIEDREVETGRKLAAVTRLPKVLPV